MKKHNQPWLSDPLKECLLILAPSIVPVIIIFAFQDYFLSHEVSTLWWIVLVLCIDVSHVYSTLFRLYWDRKTLQQYRTLLYTIPGIAFSVGFGLHYYNPQIFWRVLAYIAVYHFVRQQYGFMRLYSRKESNQQFFKWIDTLAIYNATLYPILYWHLHLTQKLNWFVKGDFIPMESEFLDSILRNIHVVILIAYAIKEIWLTWQKKSINIPKNLIVVGTYASWYVGIISFQGDLIFTLLNVVAHGIPYMGLIWIHGEKKASDQFFFTWKGAALFVGVLMLLAYLEENLWDIMIWKDHTEIFPFFRTINPLDSPMLLSIAVSILVLPQITHYVLDGFIWRFSKDTNSRIG